MKDINNINKKLLITIFTFLFLIRFIYSEYPTGISPQNNAVSSLESNSIIQWIITSSTNGYSTVARYLANFISIKGVPIYVWSIITFLMATLFFIAIYIYLFEIFIQRTGISESETMKKAKILLIFALSVFSAIAIGFAIPFLFNLYGFILLILLLVALFFFGRATISYGKSFHYAAKSFAANVEKDLLEVERELKEARRYLSEEDVRSITEGIDKVFSIYNEVENARKAADQIFQKALSNIINEYRSFINNLINDLNKNQKFKRNQQVQQFIGKLRNIKKRLDPRNPKTIPSISKFHGMLLREVNTLQLNQQNKDTLIRIINNKYNTFKQNTKIFSEIQNAINAYSKAEVKLKRLYSYEHILKNDISLRVRKFLHAPGGREHQFGMLYALDNLKNDIANVEIIINKNIQFLESLLH
jgi:hypothetical protein